VKDYQLHLGDCLDILPTLEAGSVNCCVTSPPYWRLRDYGCDGQLGLEETPEQFIEKMVAVFREVRRVLRDDGTLWLNLGDSYTGGKTGRDDKNTGGGLYNGQQNGWTGEETRQRKVPTGLKPKDLCGIPWRVALALQADGWYLRQDIIWHKPNPMPESVTDRCTKAHEYIFLLSKQARYFYDAEAIKERAGKWGERDRSNNKSHSGETGLRPHSGLTGEHSGEDGRNKRSVWTVTTKPYHEAHFATFPPKLIEPCILAGCPEGGTVLDPFAGSGTTLAVAIEHKRKAIGVELSPDYGELIRKRMAGVQRRIFV